MVLAAEENTHSSGGSLLTVVLKTTTEVYSRGKQLVVSAGTQFCQMTCSPESTFVLGSSIAGLALATRLLVER